MKRLIAISIIFMAFAACGPTSPPNTDPARNLSPSGRAAYDATKIVKALDVLRDVAYEGEKQHIFSPASALKVIAYHRQVVSTIAAVPDGWKAVALTGLVQLEKDLTTQEWAQIAPFVNLLKALYAAFGTAGGEPNAACDICRVLPWLKICGVAAA